MKKMMVILVPILLIGGVLGAAFLGVIDIPGISPAKKKPVVAKKEPVKAPETPKVKKEEPKAVPDPAKGYLAVAKIWNELPSESVIKLIDKWKDNELAQIFSKMAPDKVTEILTSLAEKTPDRAAKLTRAIQNLAESAA